MLEGHPYILVVRQSAITDEGATGSTSGVAKHHECQPELIVHNSHVVSTNVLELCWERSGDSFVGGLAAENNSLTGVKNDSIVVWQSNCYGSNRR